MSCIINYISGSSVDVNAAIQHPGQRSDFRFFEAWCGQAGLEARPATITELSTGGAKVSTISRKPAAISYWQKEHQLPSPCSMKADRELAQVYAGVRKTTGRKQEGKAAVTLKLIRRMVDTWTALDSIPGPGP